MHLCNPVANPFCTPHPKCQSQHNFLVFINWKSYQGGKKSFLFFEVDRIPREQLFAEAQHEATLILEFVFAVERENKKRKILTDYSKCNSKDSEKREGVRYSIYNRLKRELEKRRKNLREREKT